MILNEYSFIILFHAISSLVPSNLSLLLNFNFSFHNIKPHVPKILH